MKTYPCITAFCFIVTFMFATSGYSDPWFDPFETRSEIYLKWLDLQPAARETIRGQKLHTLDMAGFKLADGDKSESLVSGDLYQYLQQATMPSWQTHNERVRMFVSVRSLASLSKSPSSSVLDAKAITNPLLTGREGLFYQDGKNALLETRFALAVDDWLEVVVLPTVTFSEFAVQFQGSEEIELRKAYAIFRYKEIQVEIGRNSILWGSGRLQNLVFSGNTEAMPMIRIRNRTPVRPALFGFLGDAVMEVFATYLDKRQTFEHINLVGAKFSAKPWEKFEYGVAYTIQFGGEGGPTSAPSVILADAFVEANNPTNRNFTVDFRYDFERLGFEVYTEVLFEDCCNAIIVNPRDVLNLFGVYVPNVCGVGNWDATLELTRTNRITYRHGTFDDGYTYRNQILGHEIGPDGIAAQGALRYFLGSTGRVSLFTAAERRGRQGKDIGDNPITINNPSYQTPETRLRIELDGRTRKIIPVLEHTWLGARVGYEKVFDFAFIEGDDRSNLLAEVLVESSF